MSKLQSVPPPKGGRAPPVKALIQLDREARWLEAIWGHWELNAYWAPPILPHRWHRFEHKHRSFVAGPLTVLVRDSQEFAEEPRLVSIDGGKDSAP